MLTKQLLLRNY